MKKQPRYPMIRLRAAKIDGNALGIVSTVASALQQHGVDRAEITAYLNDALSSDYNHVLQTSASMVTFR